MIKSPTCVIRSTYLHKFRSVKFRILYNAKVFCHGSSCCFHCIYRGLTSRCPNFLTFLQCNLDNHSERLMSSYLNGPPFYDHLAYYCSIINFRFIHPQKLQKNKKWLAILHASPTVSFCPSGQLLVRNQELKVKSLTLREQFLETFKHQESKSAKS